MGIGFVLIFHFLAIFVLGLFIAFAGIVSTAIFAPKIKKRTFYISSFVIPFQWLYSTYILALMGSGIVSVFTNTDIGIGDSFSVPINDHCEMIMIDTPEYGWLKCDNNQLMTDVIEFQMSDGMCYGITDDDIYFSFNTDTEELITYSDKNELILLVKNSNTELISTSEFYTSRRWNVAGIFYIFAGIVAIVISTFISRFIFRFISRKWGRT